MENRGVRLKTWKLFEILVKAPRFENFHFFEDYYFRNKFEFINH